MILGVEADGGLLSGGESVEGLSHDQTLEGACVGDTWLLVEGETPVLTLPVGLGQVGVERSVGCPEDHAASTCVPDSLSGGALAGPVAKTIAVRTVNVLELPEDGA